MTQTNPPTDLPPSARLSLEFLKDAHRKAMTREALARAAEDHLWAWLMKGIPVENLTAETQYAAAWGRHSRDAEVAMRAKSEAAYIELAEELRAEVAALQEQLGCVFGKSESSLGDHEESNNKPL